MLTGPSSITRCSASQRHLPYPYLSETCKLMCQSEIYAIVYPKTYHSVSSKISSTSSVSIPVSLLERTRYRYSAVSARTCKEIPDQTRAHRRFRRDVLADIDEQEIGIVERCIRFAVPPEG